MVRMVTGEVKGDHPLKNNFSKFKSIYQKNRFGYSQNFSKLLVKAWQATPFFGRYAVSRKVKKVDNFSLQDRFQRQKVGG